MQDKASTTAAKASGITPTTAISDKINTGDSKASTYKPNLPAANPNPLPESPAATLESAYPAAVPASRPPAPTAGVQTSDTADMAPTDRLTSLDDDTTPTKTIPLTQGTTHNPPAPQPGSIPHPFTSTESSVSKDPSEPRPGAAPSVMSETAPIATMTSVPNPTFTMPPPVQTTYGPPEVTLRGQPLHGTVATATSTEYNNYPSAIRRGSDVAPVPGGYQQRDNLDRPGNLGEDGKREPGLLGKIGQAVDKVNEWMVGDKGSSV